MCSIVNLSFGVVLGCYAIMVASALAWCFAFSRVTCWGCWFLDYFLIDINRWWIIILNNASYLSCKLYQLFICDILFNVYATQVWVSISSKRFKGKQTKMPFGNDFMVAISEINTCCFLCMLMKSWIDSESKDLKVSRPKCHLAMILW